MKSRYGFCDVPYSPHPRQVEVVGKNKLVLEVGCGSGFISERLIKNGCKVVGIELDPSTAKKARKFCEDVICIDIEQMNKINYPNNYFDVILFGDVLEHLKDPKGVLIKLKRYLKNDGYIVITIPNAAFWSQRLRLLFGKWEYKNGGQCERTHLRFFTLKSLKKLIDESGYNIDKLDVIPYPANWFTYRLAKLWKRVLAYGFLVIATKK